MFLAALLTLLTVGSAHAADTGKTPAPWKALASCPDSDLGKKFPLPAGADRTRIIAGLHPEAFIDDANEIERPCALLYKPWKARAGHAVVVLETRRFTEQPEQDRTRSLSIGLYIEPLGTAAPIARTREPLPIAGDGAITMLDFAPYTIAPGTVAFGIRDAAYFMYAGGGGMDEALHLFRVDGDQIIPILSTLVRSSSITAGEWNDDGTRDHQEHGSDDAATVSVLKTKTAGFFDLRKSLHGRSAILKWDGESYRLKGKDPVTSVNVE